MNDDGRERTYTYNILFVRTDGDIHPLDRTRSVERHATLLTTVQDILQEAAEKLPTGEYVAVLTSESGYTRWAHKLSVTTVTTVEVD